MRNLTILLLVAVALMAGCGHTENARAALQSRQAMQGAQQLMAAPEVKAAVNALPAESQQIIAPMLMKVDALLATGERSLVPVVKTLNEGKPVEVTTTPEQAARDTAGFIQDATLQAGKADTEAEAVVAAASFRDSLGGFAMSSGSALGSLLVPGGVGGLLLAGLAKGVSMYRAVRKEADTYADAASEAVAYGNKVTLIAEKHDAPAVAQIQAAAASRQVELGVKDHIDDLIAQHA